MPKGRAVYEVQPRPDGGWALIKQGATRATRVFETKDDAVRAGREVARGQEPAQLVIKKQDNTIQTEHTYGQDPERFPG